MENSASGTSHAVGATWIHHFHLSNNSPTEDLFSTAALLGGTWCRCARMRLFVPFQANPESNWNLVLSECRNLILTPLSDF